MPKNRRLILVILLIATFLRFFLLSSVPPSPSLDEVSLGYNAYTLIETGRDEFGNRLPLLLRAYDDWRPGFYVYLVIPFVKLMGLTATAVRMPSVIMSVATVYLLYLLVNRLFAEHKHREEVALLGALVLAISPWHIYISRLGHEANLGFFATIVGAYLFVRSMTDSHKRQFLIVAAVVFALSINTYQSQKIVMPLILGLLTYSYRHTLWTMKRYVLAAVVIGGLFAYPLLRVSLSPDALTRLSGTSAFHAQNSVYQESAQAYVAAVEKEDVLGRFYYSRPGTHARVFAHQFVSHLRPAWLFGGQAREDHKIPFTGLMHAWELPFILVGLYIVFGKSSRFGIDRRVGRIILGLILLSILPAAITTQAPHAMRSYTAVLGWSMITAIGIVVVWSRIPASHKTTAIILGGLVVLLGTVNIAYHYFVTFPRLHSDSFQYPYTQALAFVSDNKQAFDHIVISNEDALYQSYMFYLFHTQYDPHEYLAAGGTISGGYAETHTIGNISFRPIDWETDREAEGSILYVGNVRDFPDDISATRSYDSLEGIPRVVLVVSDI